VIRISADPIGPWPVVAIAAAAVVAAVLRAGAQALGRWRPGED
jgi:hypothetical protein